MKLRQYQQTQVDETRQSFREGHNGVLFQLHTGGGKTVCFSSICTTAKSPVWILVHREELLNSAVKSLRKLGVNPEILHPKTKDFNPSADFVVAMVQTLKRRDYDLRSVKLLIIDECHMTDFDSQIPRFENAKRIGFSATPKRKGRQAQLTDFYTKMTTGPTIKKLIKMGFLVDCKTFTRSVISLEKLRKKGNDYREDDMYGEFDKNIIYSGIVENWKNISPNKKTIVFCVNIKHAERMTDEFNQKGVRAKFITSTMEGDRSETLNEWRRGEFPVLINASIFTTGFDEPSIECVILARATMSENLYLQMIGRGSRISPNKENFYLLDFGENVERHGTYSQDRSYSLAHKYNSKLGAGIMKECPECGAYIPGSTKVCSFCGYKYPPTKEELIEIELKPYREQDLSTIIDVTDIPKMELIRKARKYKIHWVCRQIIAKDPNNAIKLIKEYANYKNYKNEWTIKTLKRLKLIE